MQNIWGAALFLCMSWAFCIFHLGVMADMIFNTSVVVDWHMPWLMSYNSAITWQIVDRILSVAITSQSLLLSWMSGKLVWLRLTAVTVLTSDWWKKATGTKQTEWKFCLKTSREQQLAGCSPPMQVCIHCYWLRCVYIHLNSCHFHAKLVSSVFRIIMSEIV